MAKCNPLILVNPTHTLPVDYVPDGLVYCRIPWETTGKTPLPKQFLVNEAAQNLELLCASARQYSISIIGISGYRSYSRQKELYEASENPAYLAPPGTSEHQTGLAIDLSTPDIGGRLDTEFEHTDAYRFLLRNGAKFGFILRYPKGKEHLTGYPFESWHFRYTGRETAMEIMEKGICLEEFLLAKFPNIK